MVMRSKLFSLFGVVILLVGLELVGRGCVDRTMSHSIHDNTVHVRKVSVASGDVPLLFHYGIRGGLSNGAITMHDIVASPIGIAQLRVSAAQLRFDRGRFLSGEAKITGTPPYNVQLVLSSKNLRDYLNSSVTFQSSIVRVTVDGHTVFAKPALVGRTIVLKDSKKTVRIPLPGRQFLPCDPTGIAVGNGIAVACDSRTLPKVLADATK